MGDARVTGKVTAGLAERNGSLPPGLYGFSHLRADCRGPRSAPETYARFKYGTSITFQKYRIR